MDTEYSGKNEVRKMYKPNVTARLLGIPYDTLLYWRQYLDPVPIAKRDTFSAKEVLAFFVLKFLIKNRRYAPQTLSRFPIDRLFNYLNTSHSKDFSKMMIVLSDRNRTLTIVHQDSEALSLNSNFTVLNLNEAVEATNQAFWGESTSH